MYQSMTNQQYHELPYLSQSKLKHLIKNTYAAFLVESEKEKKTDSLRVGTLIHDIILNGRDVNSIKSFQQLDGRTKEGKEQKAEIEKLGEDFAWASEIEMFKSMMTNFKNSREAQKIMNSNPMIEQTGVVDVTNENGTSVRVKFRPDIVGDNFIADYKTIGDYATDSNLSKAIKNYHYAFQAAFYLEMDAIITGKRKDHYYLIFQETVASYGVRVVEIGQDTLDHAAAYVDEVFKKYFRAQENPQTISPNHEGITTLDLLYY